MMTVKEADLSLVLGQKYESSYHELNRDGDGTIRLFVKRNAVKGVVIVQWEYAGHSQWSFNTDCFGKTADDIACELAEQVKDVKSYNDLCIRILQYTTPI